jgi:hypothetical protein
MIYHSAESTYFPGFGDGRSEWTDYQFIGGYGSGYSAGHGDCYGYGFGYGAWLASLGPGACGLGNLDITGDGEGMGYGFGYGDIDGLS